jgi:amino acid permease
MPVKTLTKNNNIRKTPRLAKTASRPNNNNSMKKELVFPLVIGILFGAMIMIFWQFTARMNNQSARLVQLEEFATQNSNTVNEIVGFINSNLAPEGGNAVAPEITE